MPTYKIGYAILTQNPQQLPFASFEDSLMGSWAAGPDQTGTHPKTWYLTKREQIREDLWGGCVGYIKENDPIGLQWKNGTFKEEQVSSGEYSRFVIHLPTQRIYHQITSHIPSHTFRRRLQALLNMARASQWKVEPLRDEVLSYPDWLKTVEGVTKVRATLRAPNPRFPEESKTLKWVFEDTHADLIRMAIASGESGYLEADSDLISQILAYQEAVNTTELTVEGLIKGTLALTSHRIGEKGADRIERIEIPEDELGYDILSCLSENPDNDETHNSEDS